MVFIILPSLFYLTPFCGPTVYVRPFSLSYPCRIAPSSSFTAVRLVLQHVCPLLLPCGTSVPFRIPPLRNVCPFSHPRNVHFTSVPIGLVRPSPSACFYVRPRRLGLSLLRKVDFTSVPVRSVYCRRRSVVLTEGEIPSRAREQRSISRWLLHFTGSRRETLSSMCDAPSLLAAGGATLLRS